MPNRVRRTGRVGILAAKFGNSLFERGEALCVNELQQTELEMQPLIGFTTQIVLGGNQHVEEAGEIFFGELRGLLREPRALVGGRGDEFRVRSAHARDQQIAKMANAFAAKVLKILSVGDQAMHERQSAF